MKLITAYLAKYPSASFTLRNLGSRLEKFLRDEPHWIAPRTELALDMVRFEWAQVVAFDDGATRDHARRHSGCAARQVAARFAAVSFAARIELRVDRFLLAVKKSEAAVCAVKRATPSKRCRSVRTRKRPVRRPKRERIYLAVHRHDNMLYYKRLEPEAFAILRGLQQGKSVEKACAAALSKSKRKNVDWVSQIQEWFHDWSALGWFCRVRR